MKQKHLLERNITQECFISNIIVGVTPFSAKNHIILNILAKWDNKHGVFFLNNYIINYLGSDNYVTSTFKRKCSCN